MMNKRKWSRRDLIMLCERLGMYISAGLAPTDALSAAESGASKKQKAALEAVKGSVEQGGLLSRGLRERMKISPTIAGLIEHGEDSGELAKALTAAKTILEREDALVKTCLSAMAYPSIIGIFAILMTVGLMKGVMPQIIPLLESLHVQLPILTIAVIFLSENLIKYGAYGLLAALIAVPSVVFLYKKIDHIRFLCHTLILCMPIVGRLARYYSLALTVRSLGSLVESGAALGESYARVAETASLLPIRLIFEKESVNISRGVPLGAVLSGMKRMPSYIAPLVSAGEASGTLGLSLMRAADILDRDIEHALKRLTALVEPVMMAAMGCAVGAIALSIMMPIYDVSKALQH
jgi:general secretion pathway protein F